MHYHTNNKMERCVVWIFTLYLFLTNYLIFTSANDIYCTTKNQPQRTCHRMCHCTSKTYCPRNGKCTCSSSWMGEFCQYRNIAYGITSKGMNEKMVNLLVTYPVSALRLVSNYIYGSPPLFANITVTVRNKKHGDSNEDSICFSEEIKITASSQSIFCSTIWIGNEIHIHMSNHMDKISDIEVYGGRNVALWKDATQSSTNYGGYASRAVDGSDSEHGFGSNSCTHTKQDEDPKWNVDLDHSYMITWIQIDNRDDRLGLRLNGFKVASYGEKSNMNLYEDHTTDWNGPGDTIYLDPNNSKLPAVVSNLTIYKTGQNVRLDDSVLSLCEVSLYACRPNKIGENCLSFCPQNCNLNETCPNYQCPSCKPGWDENHCDTVKAGSAFCTETQKRVCDRSPNCSSCQSLCHCRDGQECHPLSGYCSNGCNEGWIGEACQYANIAYNASWSPVIQGSGNAECGSHNVTINLKQDYPIFVLLVVVNATTPHITTTVIASKGSKKECKNMTVTGTRIIIRCPYILRGRTINVISNQSKICNVEIYGGKNIALWTETSQSSTYENDKVSWPAKFAVDGIATTDFDAMPRSCSHTNTGNGQRAWWEIRFKNTVFITRITIFLRRSNPGRNLGIEVQLIGKGDGTLSVHNTSEALTTVELIHPAFIKGVRVNGGNKTGENILQICELQIYGCPYEGCELLFEHCKKTIHNINENFTCNDCMAGWKGSYCSIRKMCNITRGSHRKINQTTHGTVYVNGSIYFTCEAGYNLIGVSTSSCLENETWSDDFPECKVVNCTTPSRSSIPHLQDGTRWTYTYHFDEIVNLTCDKGYKLYGPQSIACNEFGNWTKDFPICQEDQSRSDAQGALPVPAIAGGGAAFLIVILVIALITVFVKRRRRPSNKRAYQEPTPNLTDQNMYAEIDKTRKKKEEKTAKKDDGAGYYNLNAIDPSTARTARNEVYYDFTIPKKPSQFAVKVTDFIDYVDERKHQNDAFGPEFRKLKSGLQFPTTFAMRSKNTPKNKYRNIYPYDDSRVVLSSIEGKQDSDYINASYIHGSFEVKHYIAAQGPLQETLEDFWRMIWQEDVGKITMLTKLSEGRKVKCAQYWPEAGEPMEMGEITVKLIDTETFADFEIRTISVTKGKDNRNVIQYHFTSWPDKGIPTYASSLVHFRAKVLNTHSPRSGPILVHCSAGIGRTGTFIALDFLLQQAKDTGYVDVFTCVEMLRRQRVNMVQTQEQYMFVHVALLEALMTPSSAIGASDFPQHYRELLEYDGDTKILKLENEFNTLNRTSPEIDDADFSQGKSSSRRKKNRYSNIIPVNGEMPIITPSSSEDQYINAVYLPAYREKNNFIITQMPLTNTIIDFWRLIHHQKVSTIVMLNTLDTKDENDLGVYWPTGNGSETFGDFKVDIVNTSVDEDGDMEIVNLSYTYKEQEPRTVRLFKAIFWPEDMTTPSSIRAFLKLIDTANLHHQRTKSTPIIVHCINGCEKSGLYCVLQVVLERLKLDQDVGIQQIIKQMRSRRPQIIPNFEQFQFCHDVVIEFMKQYDAYSNFQ